MWRRLRSAAVVAFQGDAGRKPKGDSMDSPKEKPSAPDVLVHNEGTVFLFNALYWRPSDFEERSCRCQVREVRNCSPKHVIRHANFSFTIQAFWYFSYNGRIAAAARLS